MSSPSSPFSSQPEPSRDSQPNRPVRRLQTPAERFGVAPILPLPVTPETASQPENPAPDDIFAAPSALPVAPRTRRARHERKRYRAARSEKKLVEKAPFEKKPIAGHENHEKSVQTSQNRRKKAAPRAKNRFKRVLGRLAILASAFFVIQLGVAAFTAPQFRLSQIEISGLKDTPRANVESLLAPLWGQNVFRAPRAQVAADIASLPTIASAKIQLHPTWPPRAELVVVEREPILRVGRAQKWWVADRAGVLFRRATSQDAALYPVEAPDATLATMKTLPASFWTRAVELHDALESDNRLALQVLNDSSARGQGTARANRPFWQLHRIEFGDDGAVNLNLERSETPLLTAPSSPESSANGDAAKTRENALLIRLGDEEWAPKLARARQALDYFERTGRRAAELDLVSFRRPRWRPIVVESDTPGS